MFSILFLFDWYQSPRLRAPPSGPPYAVSSCWARSVKAKACNDEEESKAPSGGSIQFFRVNTSQV